MWQIPIEKLELLEWYDNFLKVRIKRCKDDEIKEIYKNGVVWCEKTRLKLSRQIIGG